MTKEKVLGQMSAKELLGMASDIREALWIAGKEGAPLEEVQARIDYQRAIENELRKREYIQVPVEKLSSPNYGGKYITRFVRIYTELLDDANISWTRNYDTESIEIHPAHVERLLNLVFYWGQNDFQPMDIPSVSVGDVIIWSEKTYRVACVGFEKLTIQEYTQYLRLDSNDRSFLDTWRKKIK